MAINLKINGKSHKILLQNYPADITLNTFVRQHANLSGTKFMCLEGGCGVCICAIRRKHPVTNEMETFATNSCLTLLNICDGWEITTIEGLGNKKDGYHPIQKRLADLNGTQCGYCSPGMVMNMYALLERRGDQLTMEEIENSFGGNICRCTGYRPILDAMKSFGVNSDYEFMEPQCKDIEDLDKKCPRTGSACAGLCTRQRMIHAVLDDDQEWIQAHSVEDILDTFRKIGSKRYMLVAGNTAHGVYRRPHDVQVFIDINKVPELHEHKLGDTELELGANLSLTEMMNILTKSSEKIGFEFCKKVVDHIDLIANVPVRNMGTLAGNLSIKNQHREFPSDIYILLEALDAKLALRDANSADSKETLITVDEFLSTDMAKKVMTKVLIQARPESEYLFKSYKIMPRAQNAHAYVNAAFLLKHSNGHVEQARLCFGGIHPESTHATGAEKFLTNKALLTNDTIKGAMEKLKNELKPDWVLPDASPEYRRTLACSLFYKFILSEAPDIKPEFKSGGEILQRPLSSGTQIYDTRKDMYPITKPIPKIEGQVQCSGEAFYMNDLPPIPGELWASFVHATQANAQIAMIDPGPALKVPGVVAFYSAKDIPGVNSFVENGFLYPEEEEVFAKETVKFHSQPIGMIVAESLDIAKKASEKVKVLYEKLSGVIMPTMQDVFKNKAFDRIKESKTTLIGNQSNETVRGSKRIEGSFDVGSQYHYTMEPQTCICVPTEDGIDVYSSTQWVDLTQTVVARCLNVNKSELFLQVRRLGGGYGAKISRSAQIACACALAVKLLNRPVRFVQSLESMMSSVGKRLACHSDYVVDIDDKGKILGLKNAFYQDCGSTFNESPTQYLSTWTASNCYSADGNWKIQGKDVKTHAPSHTWCRAPGAVEGIAMIENIIEHIARETQQDPADVRLRNLKPGTKMEKLLPEFLASTEYNDRKKEIEQFNQSNRWRKRGLGLAVMWYPLHYFGTNPVTVSIYGGDGSVAISHGGIEMGQGLNTKVAQVAAYVLGVSLDLIKIRPSDSFTSANATNTGGSIGSETTCYAVKKACEELLARMRPIRDGLKNPSWLDVVQACIGANVSLTASHTHRVGDLKGYDIWGLCLSEVEVDILTGNLNITRVDILEDTGESLSPAIDIGQIEGAFIMAVGYWLTEKLVSNRQTGELLTNRTWTYKPPGAKDIPIDFRITLLQNSPNPAGFLRSKATGEPASCLGIAVLFALRHALDSARADTGIESSWFHLGAPTTPEDVMLNSGITVDMFTLN